MVTVMRVPKIVAGPAFLALGALFSLVGIIELASGHGGSDGLWGLLIGVPVIYLGYRWLADALRIRESSYVNREGEAIETVVNGGERVAAISSTPAMNPSPVSGAPAAPSHGDQKQRIVPYYDACFALAFSLARSIPLSEWTEKIPSGYGLRESENINKTRQLIDNGLLALARERVPRLSDASQFARGKYAPEVAAGVAECLQRLLAEIGLLTLARELITEAYEDSLDETPYEGDLEPGKQPIGDIEDIVSAYLKAWLPNLNPFVLLELASFLADQRHLNEANEALSAVETFPEYSRSKKSDPHEGSAQAIALETLPPDLVRSITPISLTRVCYSADARQRLLPTEIARIQTRLREIVSLANEDRQNAQLPSPTAEPASATPELISDQYPSPERIKEVWDVWQKEGEAGLVNYFKGQQKRG